MYSLFIDKNEEFACKIVIEGADSSKSSPRLFIKTKNWDLVFEGKIKDGQCIIPLKKLSSVINEGDKGDIRLEVIVDDTVLIPWENTFEAKVSKKVKVDVAENTASSNKPKIVVEVQSNKPTTQILPSQVKQNSNKTFVDILKEHNITYQNISENRKKVSKLFNEYAKTVDQNRYKYMMNNYKQFMKETLLSIK
jgi:hypothetical protein